MKKQLNNAMILILSALLVLSVSGCKKDYPKDIPKWVKKKIREFKEKEDPINDNNYFHYEVEELSNDTVSIFVLKSIRSIYDAVEWTYCDYRGNTIGGWSHDSFTQEPRPFSWYHSVRIIWELTDDKYPHYYTR
ncbi:MAG: hypothetical protein HY063_07510 [Bacteroidetes bacterium]|nr:hypothetical protein [Bacteroidota bacterium]